ncbi:MAG: hypothetical protein AMXMBFR82_05130 [Candidatus Hydrogenedentota bacterium]
MVRSLVVAFGVLYAWGTMAHATPIEDLVKASTAFLDALDADQRSAAVFPFNDEERLNWHFVPKERAGVAFKSMSPEQKELALDVLRAALSAEGYDKVETIRSLETVLREIEGRDYRDTELFYFTFFGAPAVDGVWGLRYEGHHISLNWTAVDGAIIAAVPQFLGANPAEVLSGPMQGTRALAAEEDLARTLVQSLNEEQRAECILHEAAPPDIVTGAARVAEIQEHRGLAYSALNEDQQGILLSLLQVFADCQRPELAQERIQKVRDAGLESVKFGWMGGTEKGEKYYYRIQGPTFIVEYDNTQNDANHIHTVWRDFEGDFGRDVLKEHYEKHADPANSGEHEH